MLSWNRRTRVRTAATALALGLAVTVLPATARAAPAPTGVEPAAPVARAAAGGWNDDACAPSAERPRPVVLVHGTLGNSVSNWIGLAPYLADRGWCVFSLDYGRLPGIAVFHGLGPIEDSSAELAAYVDRVLAVTGAGEVDIVGHSQGGMMPRHYLKHHDGAADKVNALVGLSPSTNGSTVHGLTKLFDLFPGARDVLEGLTPALEQQIAGSPFLTELNADGYTVPGVDYTVIATRWDEVVTPYRSQYIHEEGVTNVLLQDLCPASLSEHLAIALVDRVAWHEVTNALDPAGARPSTCWSVLD
ncbi:esterase/lipase family protein [Streptomyces bohaiensis]|uniref:esterase/lipase family protein n=1 Tax=Streptomyces bohaiensis TaxID=1431344 RepID=UPI003B7FE877